MSRTWGRQRDEAPPDTPPMSPGSRLARGVAHGRTDFVPMLTTAVRVGVGSPRSGRRRAVRRGHPTGRQGGREVRKRSWGWRVAAVAAALALALGLAACGDDDDSGSADTAASTTGGSSESFDVAYVTAEQHPYGIAVDAFTKQVNATGQLTLKGQPL